MNTRAFNLVFSVIIFSSTILSNPAKSLLTEEDESNISKNKSVLSNQTKKVSQKPSDDALDGVSLPLLFDIDPCHYEHPPEVVNAVVSFMPGDHVVETLECKEFSPCLKFIRYLNPLTLELKRRLHEEAGYFFEDEKVGSLELLSTPGSGTFFSDAPDPVKWINVFTNKYRNILNTPTFLKKLTEDCPHYTTEYASRLHFFQKAKKLWKEFSLDHTISAMNIMQSRGSIESGHHKNGLVSFMGLEGLFSFINLRGLRLGIPFSNLSGQQSSSFDLRYADLSNCSSAYPKVFWSRVRLEGANLSGSFLE